MGTLTPLHEGKAAYGGRDRAENTLVKRYLDNKIDQATYNEQIVVLGSDTKEIEAGLRASQDKKIDLEEMLTFASMIVTRPARLWVDSSLDQRQRMQSVLFPAGITFDASEFRNALRSSL